MAGNLLIVVIWLGYIGVTYNWAKLQVLNTKDYRITGLQDTKDYIIKMQLSFSCFLMPQYCPLHSAELPFFLNHPRSHRQCDLSWWSCWSKNNSCRNEKQRHLPSSLRTTDTFSEAAVTVSAMAWTVSASCMMSKKVFCCHGAKWPATRESVEEKKGADERDKREGKREKTLFWYILHDAATSFLPKVSLFFMKVNFFLLILWQAYALPRSCSAIQRQLSLGDFERVLSYDGHERNILSDRV